MMLKLEKADNPLTGQWQPPTFTKNRGGWIFLNETTVSVHSPLLYGASCYNTDSTAFLHMFEEFQLVTPRKARSCQLSFDVWQIFLSSVSYTLLKHCSNMLVTYIANPPLLQLRSCLLWIGLGKTTLNFGDGSPEKFKRATKVTIWQSWCPSENFTYFQLKVLGAAAPKRRSALKKRRWLQRFCSVHMRLHTLSPHWEQASPQTECQAVKPI